MNIPQLSLNLLVKITIFRDKPESSCWFFRIQEDDVPEMNHVSLKAEHKAKQGKNGSKGSKQKRQKNITDLVSYVSFFMGHNCISIM